MASYIIRCRNHGDRVVDVAPGAIIPMCCSWALDPKLGRHAQSERFHAMLAEIGALHDRKQADYGRDDAPFANVQASEEWGVEAWTGAMIRLNDKVRRLQKRAKGGILANEGVVDSLNDIAVYALIARVLYEEAHGDG